MTEIISRSFYFVLFGHNNDPNLICCYDSKLLTDATQQSLMNDLYVKQCLQYLLYVYMTAKKFSLCREYFANLNIDMPKMQLLYTFV